MAYGLKTCRADDFTGVGTPAVTSQHRCNAVAAQLAGAFNDGQYLNTKEGLTLNPCEIKMLQSNQRE